MKNEWQKVLTSESRKALLDEIRRCGQSLALNLSTSDRAYCLESITRCKAELCSRSVESSFFGGSMGTCRTTLEALALLLPGG